MNEFLHSFMISTWHYKHQIFEVPGLLTALLITYDDQPKDEYEVYPATTWEAFLQRMSKVKPDWAYFDREDMERLALEPHRSMGGWEGRTVYFIRGGGHPEFWKPERVPEDGRLLLTASARLQGPMITAEADAIAESLPRGREHYREYEDFVRKVINYLFPGQLGEAKAQVRTEAGNEGTEIRDLLAHNIAQAGFFADLKSKYSCSEILFDAKNTDELTRDDLRQIYCYLKPAIGLWGFLVCRSSQPEVIHSYNRTLFKNFAQTRGLQVLTDDDLRAMIAMRTRERDPSDHLQQLFSSFIRGV